MVCTYLQTHQVVYIKYVPIFVCSLYLKKTIKKKNILHQVPPNLFMYNFFFGILIKIMLSKKREEVKGNGTT